MRLRLLAAVFGIVVAVACVCAGVVSGRQTATHADHAAWVAGALKRMQTIKPGMTRKDLLVAFTTEGGLSTGLQRTYVSRDCPYFKVDVEFKAVGRPDRATDGRTTSVEGDEDRIVRISRPYLQFTHAD